LSRYKKLENQWATVIKEGKEVFVVDKINYDGNNIRPSSFNTEYEIDRRVRFISSDN
jgi:hypothetical protein